MIDWTTARTETRGLVFGAYRGEDRAMLTHLVALDADGFAVKVACRVQIDGIDCDVSESTAGVRASRPTCPRCAVKWDKRQEAKK